MTTVWHFACYFSLVLILLSFFFCLIRIIKGPDLPNRVIALDLTATTLISFIAIYSMMRKETSGIDVVIGLALIIFLTTVAFANLIFHQSTKDETNQ